MVQNKEQGKEGRRKRRRGTHSLQLRNTHLSLYCSGGAGGVACCVLQDIGLIYCQSERANLGGQSPSQRNPKINKRGKMSGLKSFVREDSD